MLKAFLVFMRADLTGLTMLLFVEFVTETHEDQPVPVHVPFARRLMMLPSVVMREASWSVGLM